MGKKGVLLINVGTPTEPTVESVRKYLREFLLDPDVIDIPAPLRHLLVRGIILRVRPKNSNFLGLVETSSLFATTLFIPGLYYYQYSDQQNNKFHQGGQQM